MSPAAYPRNRWVLSSSGDPGEPVGVLGEVEELAGGDVLDDRDAAARMALFLVLTATTDGSLRASRRPRT
jgi:hypothetical protein